MAKLRRQAADWAVLIDQWRHYRELVAAHTDSLCVGNRQIPSES